MRLTVLVGLVGLLICASPASADWAVGNHELTDLGSGALAGSGYSSAGGSSGGSTGATSGDSTNGTTTNGGGWYQVDRVYVKEGSPTDRDIHESISIEGHGTAMSFFGGGAGGYSHAKSTPDAGQFPDATPLDDDRTINSPAGPVSASYSADNSGEVLANKTIRIAANITLTGVIYAYASTNVNTNGISSSEASSTLGFSNP